jgi:DNA polymerase III epsilon subunit-like protein
MFTFVVVDVETTGLDKRSNRIISIGAKVFNTHEVRTEHALQPVRTYSAFHAFVNPGQPNAAFEINHIADEYLADKPGFPHVARDFWNWVYDVYLSTHNPIVLVGHNFDSFDEPMFAAEHVRNKCLDLVPRDILFKVDTMKLLKCVFPQTVKSVPYGLPITFHGPNSYRQADIYEFLFGDQPHLQHSALGDACALERILMHPSVSRLLAELKRPDSIVL